MFRLVVLPCFDLCRSNSSHVHYMCEYGCGGYVGGFMRVCVCVYAHVNACVCVRSEECEK